MARNETAGPGAPSAPAGVGGGAISGSVAAATATLRRVGHLRTTTEN